MKQIVFYSWQSDLPNSTNRGFIQQALENAAAVIAADESVAVVPVVDRDTQGIPGAPDIASTIFSKITAADVFVADVSIIGRDENRATPNPNVLIELGYALKALGHEKVILVFNRAYGKIEELPFDLRMRRVLAYETAEGQAKAPERKALEKQIEAAIRAALEHGSKGSELPGIPAVTAIENQEPNRIVVVRRNLDAILQRLDALQPKPHSKGGAVKELIAGIGQTQEPVAEFSKIAESVAIMNDAEMAIEVQRWFGKVFERYSPPENFSGISSNADQDFFKFLGHELFVSFVAFLLREQRWGLLRRVLEEPIPMRYIPRWEDASAHLPSIIDEGRRNSRICMHSDLLNERHTSGGLAAIMPMDEFVAADYFLFLLAELPPEKAPDVRYHWRPWSALYLKGTPMFLRAGEQKRVADEILKLFNMSGAEEFKRRFRERASRLEEMFPGGFWLEPIREDDITRFGTR